MPVWHISVASRHDNGGILPAGKVAGFKFRAIRAYMIEILKGSGTGPTKFEHGETAFHMRRRLSDQEIAGLPQTWCQIPPTDEGGGDLKFIEWIPE